MTGQNERAFDEDAAKRILERAATIDAKVIGRLSETDLRAVALEAGISEQALAAALAEADGVVATILTEESPLRTWRRIRSRSVSALAGVLGLCAGAAAWASTPYTSTAHPSEPVLLAAALLVAVSIAGAARMLKRNAFSAYRLINGALWIGFLGGYTLMNGQLDETVIMTGISWGSTTLLAGLMVLFKRYWDTPAPPAGASRQAV